MENVKDSFEREITSPTMGTFILFTNNLCNKGERALFRGGSDIPIHEFFYGEAQRNPLLFKEYIFQDRMGFHFSEGIHDEVSALQISGKMTAWGLDYNPYELIPAIGKRIARIPSTLVPVYQEIAERFYSQLGFNSNSRVGRPFSLSFK